MSKIKEFKEASLKDKKTFAKYLSEDEELVLATGYGANHVRHQFILYIAYPGGIFFIGGIGLFYLLGWNIGYGMLWGLVLAMMVAFLKALLVYHSHRYLLTTRRLIVKKGFFAVKLTSALYDKITHIEVDQSFWDRMVMKHGTLIINTAGMSKGEIIVENIDQPIIFKNLLERLINREREQMGHQTGEIVEVEGEIVD